MRPLAFVVLLAHCLAAADPDPVAWKLERAAPAPVKAGATFSVKVVAQLQEGWHIYSMKLIEGGPFPTRVWIPENQQFQQAGAIRSEAPRTMMDQSLGMEVEVYEGMATFTVPVKVAAGTGAGAANLVFNTSYQTCNASLCLPPKTVNVQTRVTIAK
jgi:thiol:disulfide interchange protein DsbD